MVIRPRSAGLRQRRGPVYELAVSSTTKQTSAVGGVTSISTSTTWFGFGFGSGLGSSLTLIS